MGAAGHDQPLEDHHRRRSPRPRPPSEDGAIDRVGERDTLVRALRTLTRRQREVVVLRFLNDLTEAEVARQLGVSVGTVKTQVHRARTSLRVHLDERKDCPMSSWTGRPLDPEREARLLERVRRRGRVLRRRRRVVATGCVASLLGLAVGVPVVLGDEERPDQVIIADEPERTPGRDEVEPEAVPGTAPPTTSPPSPTTTIVPGSPGVTATTTTVRPPPPTTSPPTTLPPTTAPPSTVQPPPPDPSVGVVRAYFAAVEAGNLDRALGYLTERIRTELDYDEATAVLIDERDRWDVEVSDDGGVRLSTTDGLPVWRFPLCQFSFIVVEWSGVTKIDGEFSCSLPPPG